MWPAEKKFMQIYKGVKRLEKSNECCVCYKTQQDVFEGLDGGPRALGVMPCGHWICIECRWQIEETKYEVVGNRTIECPICRNPFTGSQINWMRGPDELEFVEKYAKRRRVGDKICFTASKDKEWWELEGGFEINGEKLPLPLEGHWQFCRFLDYTFGSADYKLYKVNDSTLYGYLQSKVDSGDWFVLRVTQKKNGKVCGHFKADSPTIALD